MSDAPQKIMLPGRPRLAEGAMLRYHHVDGELKAVVHDRARSEVIEVEPHQLEMLRGVDGTRDVGGIALAAVRAGVFTRMTELEGLLANLMERGLLTDGIELSPKAGEREAEAPLEVLPGFMLDCDAGGTCCTTYSSVPFTTDDAARAIAAVPELAPDAKARRRLFLPLYGAVDTNGLAVAMRDGACSFLADDGRCRVHNAAGADQKPVGCGIYPSTFVDDGVAVRVSVACECACVMKSAGGSAGDPIVPEGATHARDLASLATVVRVPETLRVGDGRTAPRDALRGWADAVVEGCDALTDPLAAAWALAHALDDDGLDADAAGKALAVTSPPPAAAFAAHLAALAKTCAAKRASADGWRGKADRCRLLATWLEAAAQRLTDPAEVTALLEAGPRHVADERHYLRTGAWGHHYVKSDRPMADVLRDVAVRMLLARALDGAATPAVDGDPSRHHPITAVEAMMRGQGLESYALGLG